jgi:hypothetical protein
MEELYELRPDGRKVVVEREEGEKKVKELVDLPEVSFGEIPKKFRDYHREALNAIYGFGEKLAADGRTVPLTREELMKVGIGKETLKDLERFEYIESHIAELKANGQNIGGRKVVVVSPQGKALIKFFSSAVSEALSSEGQTSSGPQTDSPQDQPVQS